jgi:hypothetical protein
MPGEGEGKAEIAKAETLKFRGQKEAKLRSGSQAQPERFRSNRRKQR